MVHYIILYKLPTPLHFHLLSVKNELLTDVKGFEGGITNYP